MKALRLATAILLVTSATSAWSIDFARGQRLYNQHCASCHGITGIPVMPETPNLAMREGMNQPDFMLMQTLKMGKKAMPPYLGLLKDEELLDIIQYTRMMR